MGRAKTPEYYRRLPYTKRVRLVEEDTGEMYFVASITELDGVEVDGDTPHEAISNLADAFEDYIAAMFEWGEQIPEPERWPESLGWSSSDGLVEGRASISAYVAEVPRTDDPRAQTPWVQDVPRDRMVDEVAAV